MACQRNPHGADCAEQICKKVEDLLAHIKVQLQQPPTYAADTVSSSSTEDSTAAEEDFLSFTKDAAILDLCRQASHHLTKLSEVVKDRQRCERRPSLRANAIPVPGVPDVKNAPTVLYPICESVIKENLSSTPPLLTECSDAINSATHGEHNGTRDDGQLLDDDADDDVIGHATSSGVAEESTYHVRGVGIVEKTTTAETGCNAGGKSDDDKPPTSPAGIVKAPRQHSLVRNKVIRRSQRSSNTTAERAGSEPEEEVDAPTYVDMSIDGWKKHVSWFFGKIGKEACADMMLNNGGELRVGDFAVRELYDKPESFVIAVLQRDDAGTFVVVEFAIQHIDDTFFVRESSCTFKSMPMLISRLRENNEILQITLCEPCPSPELHLSLVCGRPFETTEESLSYITYLRKGKYGEVWKGILDGMEVEIHKFMPDQTASSLTEFVDDSKLINILRHPNVINILATLRTPGVTRVMELVHHSSLIAYLRTKEPAAISFSNHIEFAAQIACGMDHLTRLNCVHRDLRAANISLVIKANTYTCKISNFGLAKLTRNGRCYAPLDWASPVKWSAPEVIQYGICTHKSDVWSYAVLLVELVTGGKPPYPGMTNAATATNVIKGYRMLKPRLAAYGYECPQPLYDIMLKCWREEASKRLTFEYLQYFFEDYETAVEPIVFAEIS